MSGLQGSGNYAYTRFFSLFTYWADMQKQQEQTFIPGFFDLFTYRCKSVRAITFILRPDNFCSFFILFLSLMILFADSQTDL